MCEQVLNYTSSLYAGTIAFAVPFAVVLWVTRMHASLPADVLARPRAFLYFVTQPDPLSTVVMPFAGVAIMVDDWLGSRVSIAEIGLLGQTPEFLPHRFLIDVAIAATGYAAIAAGTYASSFWFLAFTGVFVVLGILWLVYTRFGVSRAWKSVEQVLRDEKSIEKLTAEALNAKWRKEIDDALDQERTKKRRRQARDVGADLNAANDSSAPLLAARGSFRAKAMENSGLARVFAQGAIFRIDFTIADHILCIITLLTFHGLLLALKQRGGLLALSPDLEVWLGVYFIGLIGWRRHVFSRIWEGLQDSDHFKRLLRI